MRLDTKLVLPWAQVPFRHPVRVLTDDEAAPSSGKKPFSIATYFKNLGGVEQMTVVEAQIDAEGAYFGTSRGAGQAEIKVVRLSRKQCTSSSPSSIAIDAP